MRSLPRSSERLIIAYMVGWFISIRARSPSCGAPPPHRPVDGCSQPRC